MLTDSKVRQAKPQPKVYKLPDGRGLHLLVHPNGGKYWQVRYRFAGKEKTASLGPYPEVSISDARDGREALRKQLRTGVDPLELRKAEKRARLAESEHTFEKVARAWFEVWQKGKESETVAYKLRRMEGDLFKDIGHRPVSDISRKEVIDLVKKIASRGVNETAHRALQVLKQVFSYAVTHEIRDFNPISDLRPSDLIGTVPTKNYARIKAEELPSLLSKIQAYEGLVTRHAMLLMCLTFVRTGTLRMARWNEFDLESRLWNIPAEHMKKVKGQRSPHIVPLPTQAIRLLESLKKLSGGGDYLFPGESGAMMSENTILKALDRMGYKGQMTGHGFRGLASTILHENGFEKAHIDRQMAHLDRSSVSAAYNYAEYLKQRTEMMSWWGDYLEALHARSTS
jgi:integrase